MYHDYFEQILARERGLELEHWLELKRQIRESQQRDPQQAIATRLRMGVGTVLLRIGVALIGCEELARSLLERRTLRKLP